MDPRLLTPTGSPIRLGAHQALLGTARAGTWLQVQRGVLAVQAAPRALDFGLPAPAQRLTAGAGMALSSDGWWRLAADTGPVEVRVVAPAEVTAHGASAAFAAWLREVAHRAAAVWSGSKTTGADLHATR